MWVPARCAGTHFDVFSLLYRRQRMLEQRLDSLPVLVAHRREESGRGDDAAEQFGQDSGHPLVNETGQQANGLVWALAEEVMRADNHFLRQYGLVDLTAPGRELGCPDLEAADERVADATVIESDAFLFVDVDSDNFRERGLPKLLDNVSAFRLGLTVFVPKPARRMRGDEECGVS